MKGIDARTGRNRRWLAFALAVTLVGLAGCDLSPQPLPPGQFQGSTGGPGSQEGAGASDDAALAESPPPERGDAGLASNGGASDGSFVVAVAEDAAADGAGDAGDGGGSLADASPVSDAALDGAQETMAGTPDAADGEVGEW